LVSKLLREPLVHFLALGLALFGLYALVAPRDSGETIVISRARVEGIARQYQATWNRPPSPDELKALVEADIREEIFYREGLAQGLDKDDAVIKRRVRQKYELIAEEEGTAAAPTDAELQAWLTEHPEAFIRPPVVSFTQILLREDSPMALAAAQKALAAGQPAAGLGAATMLPETVSAEPLDLVARDFGAQFAAGLDKAPLGSWTPLRSGYGLHMARLSARTPAVRPPLDEIQPQVAREWESDRRKRSAEARYEALRKAYDVEIETP
jgi:hypothetical protein